MTIPTEDPNAALQFCRMLATLIRRSRPDYAPSETDVHPELSVVLPVCNEEGNLPLLYERLKSVMKAQDTSYEIVFVDDGSYDRSLEIMDALAAEDRHVVIVELARNFGHQVAISAGLDYARGKGVIVMDTDLQDPPELLSDLIEKWHEGYDVVYAVRKHRKEGWFKRSAYAVFYRLLQRGSNINIPLDSGDFCIMDRKVVNLLRSMPERNRLVRGIRSWVGLRQIGLPY
jgi:dolichol-phosphate mannosyltransferase